MSITHVAVGDDQAAGRPPLTGEHRRQESDGCCHVAESGLHEPRPRHERRGAQQHRPHGADQLDRPHAERSIGQHDAHPEHHGRDHHLAHGDGLDAVAGGPPEERHRQHEADQR